MPARTDRSPAWMAGLESPLERFLGPRSDERDPWGLLRLDRRNADRRAVFAALRERLAEIDTHPEGRTPAADEARMAIHAAAARAATEVSQAPGRGEPSRRPTDAENALASDVAIAIGLHGGWNTAAMRHVAKVAHARGLPSSAVPGAVSAAVGIAGVKPQTNGTGGAAAPHAASGGTHAVATSAPAEASRGRTRPSRPGLLPWLAVACGVGLLALAAVSLMSVLSASGPKPTGEIATQETAAPPGSPLGTERRETAVASNDGPEAVSRPERNLSDPAALLQEFRAVRAGFETDPGAAAARFAELVQIASATWPERPPEAREALRRLVIECVHLSHADPRAMDAALMAVVTLAAPADGPIDRASLLREIWASGVLTRLSAERELAGSVQRTVMDLLTRRGVDINSGEATFRVGAVRALRDVGNALVMVPRSQLNDRGGASRYVESWRAWLEAAAALETDAVPLDMFVRSSLDALVRHPEGRAPGPERRQAIGLLAESLEWSDGASRAWLLSVMDDTRSVPTGAINAITETLATRTGAEGVDLTMVLSADASDLDRASMRDRYAKEWAFSEGGPSGLTERLLVARDELDRAELASGPVGELALATALARWNAAAAMAWRRDDAGAERLLAGLAQPVATVLETADGIDPGALSRTAERRPAWARDYLAAGSHGPKRLELLGQLGRRSGGVSMVEAEVLVSEAVRGSPREVRDRAASLVRGFAGEVTVVNALLEQAHRMPETDRNTDLVRDVTGTPLPDDDDPDWHAAVRRALSGTLLEMLGGVGDGAAIDALAAMLASALADELGTSDPATASDPLGAARSISARWERRARRGAGAGIDVSASMERLEPAAIARKLAARLSVAQGPIQRFAAQQRTLVDWMALAVLSESGGTGPAATRIGQVLEQVAERRRRASTAFGQIRAAEEARAELWQIRMEER